MFQSEALNVAHFHSISSGLQPPQEDGVIRCWKEAEWLSDYQHEHMYKFDGHEGKVTVKNEGLYYIYSQIHYHNAATQSGHRVYVDDQSVFECFQGVDWANHSKSEDNYKHKSCYTGGIQHLKAGQAIQIKDAFAQRSRRYMMMEPELSFWGLYKIQDAKKPKKSKKSKDGE